MDEHTELLIELMRKTIEQKDEQIQKLNETIEELQVTVASLNETIEEFRRKFFGSSSERNRRKDPQAQEEVGPEEITVKSYKRQRKPKSTRNELYKNLPVREVRCAMPEDERLCPDCDTPMVTIAWQYVREELSITPAKVERIRYLREVLACPVCREEDTGTIIKAPTPTALLAHSPASPSMVAFVMYQKFMNAVPFYRQEMDWLQMGAPLARETTAGWCIKCALTYFQPVYDLLHKYLCKREILHADETVCQVLHEEEIPEEAADPERAIEKNKIPAEIGLSYCNRLFRTERRLKEMDAEERKEERLKQEVPIWEKFFAWLETIEPLKGSRLEKAVNYAVNHRDLLCNYLLDGRCEISNNRAERRAKSYGTGRKNFLFHDTVKGAKSSAVIYSLVETAKANKLNVFQYLYTLLLYMPDYKDKAAGVEAMMPWSDFIKERCSGVMDVSTETPENRGQIPLE